MNVNNGKDTLRILGKSISRELILLLRGGEDMFKYVPTCVAKLTMYCDPYLTPAFVNYTSCVYLHKKSLCL